MVLVSIDTLRADHTSLDGYARDTTPNLARIAREGARFATAYAPSASTAPSHASLFTGRHPAGHGLVKNGLPLLEAHPTLAEVLADHGYQTAGVVGSFPLDPRFGFAQGFEHYDARFERSSSRGQRWEGRTVERFDRIAEETTDRALAWLEAGRDPSRPLFLFVHYFDPHSPYAPPGEHGLRFSSSEIAAGSLEHRVQLYDAEIAYVDQQIGRLLAGLEGAGLLDDALLVVTADHGEGLGDHGVMLHAIHLYEEAVRVPLLFRMPGVVAAGRVFDEPVSLVDVPPTVLSLVGLEGALDHEGQDLAPVLRGERGLVPGRPIFLQRRPYPDATASGVKVNGPLYAVRAGRFKLLDAPDQGLRALYDLEADPDETRDLYYDEPQVARRLVQQLARWREATERPPVEHALGDEERRALETLGYVE